MNGNGKSSGQAPIRAARRQQTIKRVIALYLFMAIALALMAFFFTSERSTGQDSNKTKAEAKNLLP